MVDVSKEERIQLLKSYPFRELWQTLATGNSYTCFLCQSVCPTGRE